jgi:hypothetical protein
MQESQDSIAHRHVRGRSSRFTRRIAIPANVNGTQEAALVVHTLPPNARTWQWTRCRGGIGRSHSPTQRPHSNGGIAEGALAINTLPQRPHGNRGVAEGALAVNSCPNAHTAIEESQKGHWRLNAAQRPHGNRGVAEGALAVNTLPRRPHGNIGVAEGALPGHTSPPNARFAMYELQKEQSLFTDYPQCPLGNARAAEGPWAVHTLPPNARTAIGGIAEGALAGSTLPPNARLAMDKLQKGHCPCGPQGQ